MSKTVKMRCAGCFGEMLAGLCFLQDNVGVTKYVDGFI